MGKRWAFDKLYGAGARVRNDEVNHRYDHRTRLSVAAQNGDGDKVEMLLQLGADPFVADCDGRVPMTFALGDAKKSLEKGMLKLANLCLTKQNLTARDRYALDWYLARREITKASGVVKAFEYLPESKIADRLDLFLDAGVNMVKLFDSFETKGISLEFVKSVRCVRSQLGYVEKLGFHGLNGLEKRMFCCRQVLMLG